MKTLMGLDLSVRATAAVVVATDWDMYWPSVKSMVAGRSLKKTATNSERIARIDFIAKRVLAFAQEWGVSEAWIESYAFSQSDMAHTIGELGGIVKVELFRAGIDIHIAQQSTTRKFLLGKVPRTSDEQKRAVSAAVRQAGGHFETFDESDAFCAVNYALSEAGGVCLCQAPT